MSAEYSGIGNDLSEEQAARLFFAQVREVTQIRASLGEPDAVLRLIAAEREAARLYGLAFSEDEKAVVAQIVQNASPLDGLSVENMSVWEHE